MNTTTTISGVERLNDAGPAKGHDPDGKPYWTRLITCHGGGHTATLILHALRPDALELISMFSLEAQLAKMDNDSLDALSNAIRAERQSRTPQPAPDAQDYPTLAEYEAALHPRDCPGGPVTVTEDDGEVPF